NQLGKPAGQDLAEGIYNLPTLFALEDAARGDELRALLGRALNDDERERARKLVVATEGIARTIDTARDFLDQADRALTAVASATLREAFGAFIASLLEDLPAY
ncbi:MAG TPA: hypothetical protein PLS29_07515, partial [Acidimicrobiales bacterium]|nr:hypothetical protein [Acidimicrobiales bacterium]